MVTSVGDFPLLPLSFLTGCKAQRERDFVHVLTFLLHFTYKWTHFLPLNTCRKCANWHIKVQQNAGMQWFLVMLTVKNVGLKRSCSLLPALAVGSLCVCWLYLRSCFSQRATLRSCAFLLTNATWRKSMITGFPRYLWLHSTDRGGAWKYSLTPVNMIYF